MKANPTTKTISSVLSVVTGIVLTGIASAWTPLNQNYPNGKTLDENTEYRVTVDSISIGGDAFTVKQGATLDFQGNKVTVISSHVHINDPNGGYDGNPANPAIFYGWNDLDGFIFKDVDVLQIQDTHFGTNPPSTCPVAIYNCIEFTVLNCTFNFANADQEHIASSAALNIDLAPKKWTRS